MSSSNSSATPAGFWRKAARDAAILAALALLAAVASGWLHLRRGGEWLRERPAVEELTVAEIARMKSPVLWVDARPQAEFRQQHVPGAVLLNQDNWEERLPEFMAAWQPGMRVVVYCRSEKCRASHDVAQRLRRELQIENVFALRDGWAGWQRAPKP
jgi:rhodanese-related sulfurtransferase